MSARFGFTLRGKTSEFLKKQSTFLTLPLFYKTVGQGASPPGVEDGKSSPWHTLQLPCARFIHLYSPGQTSRSMIGPSLLNTNSLCACSRLVASVLR